jgi:hypothetical protein
MQADNSTANGILNGTVKQQRSRAMDMRFYWMKDRTQQGQFNVLWAPGRDNLADYFTKHHSPAHHRLMRPQYLHEPKSIHSRIQRGCVESQTKAKVTRMFGRRPSACGPPSHIIPNDIDCRRINANNKTSSSRYPIN